MADAPKFNLRNPAVKRIMQEVKEIRQDSSGDFLAEALETDIFEWHFVIRGPPDTEFDGGIYHGRILLPPEYPFKPPSFMMLTPNGRFEVNMKICLSISSHHPEHWQPSWSVRTALTALIAFMPSPGAGSLGALDFPKEERRALAVRSRLEPPRFGNADRQRLIDEMHNRMLAAAATKMTERSPSGSADTGAVQGPIKQEESGVEPQGNLAVAAGGSEDAPAAVAGAAVAVAASSASERQGSDEASPAAAAAAAIAAAVGGMQVAAAEAAAGSSRGDGDVPLSPSATGSASVGETAPGRSDAPGATAAVTPTSDPQLRRRSVLPHLESSSTSATATPASAAGLARTAAAASHPPAPNAAAAAAAAAAVTSTDHMLTALMWALYFGIGAILLRKVMGVIGFDLTELLQ